MVFQDVLHVWDVEHVELIEVHHVLQCIEGVDIREKEGVIFDAFHGGQTVGTVVLHGPEGGEDIGHVLKIACP